MTMYINKDGKKVLYVRTVKRYWGKAVIYRPEGIIWDCMMSYRDFHHQFKRVEAAEVES